MRRQHLERRTQRHHLSAIHDRQAITGQGLIEVVQGDDGGDRQLMHEPENLQLPLDIQMIGRLIQQQDLRPLCQGPGDVRALTFSA